MKERFALRAGSLVATVALVLLACGDSGSQSPTADGTSGGPPDAASEGGPTTGTDAGGGDGDGGPIVPSDVGESVYQVGHDVYHRMHFVQPTLTHAAVTSMAPDTTFNGNATFPAIGNTNGQGLASVLYVESGPAGAGCPAGATGCKATARAAGAGIFLAFPALGANPNVYAFDETTGLATWTAHVKNASTGGGDGIRGTPAIDPTSRRIFIVTGPNPHTVHAISLDTGVEVTTGGWPVTLAKATLSYLGTQFNSASQNQRGALLLLKNTLYIPFGGEDGDGGDYRGWVVAIDITNPASVGGWATLSPQSGIWASGGLASDGTNVFAETGNSTGTIRPDSTPMSSWDSEEVVRLSGLAKPTRDGANVFVPDDWKKWDQGDLDLGSSSPAVAPLPAGSDPPSLVIAPAKPGTVFVLNGGNLSGGAWPQKTGGQLAQLAVANTGGQSVYTAPTIYGSASGLHTAIASSGGGFPLCPGATKDADGAIISILLNPGKSPVATVQWCVENAAGVGSNWFPPISTTTDGISGEPIVWFLSKGATDGENQLTGVDGDNGNVLVQTKGAACSTVPSLSFPIVVKGHVVVAAIGHLCSWSIDGK